jgi:hypothetical protein
MVRRLGGSALLEWLHRSPGLTLETRATSSQDWRRNKDFQPAGNSANRLRILLRAHLLCRRSKLTVLVWSKEDAVLWARCYLASCGQSRRLVCLAAHLVHTAGADVLPRKRHRYARPRRQTCPAPPGTFRVRDPLSLP